jgi:hypothetical protein
MKSIIGWNSLLVLVLFMASCNEKTCKDFHSGKFITPDEKVEDIRVIRNDSIQIEESVKRGFKHVYNITWVDDCNYYLTFKSTNNQEENWLSNKDTLWVGIMKIEGDLHEYHARVNRQKEPMIGVYKQVKEF